MTAKPTITFSPKKRMVKRQHGIKLPPLRWNVHKNLFLFSASRCDIRFYFGENIYRKKINSFKNLHILQKWNGSDGNELPMVK